MPNDTQGRETMANVEPLSPNPLANINF